MLNTVDLIKEKISIYQMCQHLGIDVKGNAFRCFNKSNHRNGDRNPSVVIYPRSNSFKCQVCENIGGSVIDLYAQFYNISFSEAVKKISKEFNIIRRLRDRSPIPSLREVDTNVYSIYKSIMNLCEYDVEAARFAKSRGILKDTYTSQRILHINQNVINNIRRRLKTIKGGPEYLVKIGLYNMKREMIFSIGDIVLPVFNDGIIKSFQIRRNSAKRKYINPFNSEQVVYNNDLSLPGSNSKDIYVCEGILDCLYLLDKNISAMAFLGAGAIYKIMKNDLKNQMEWVRSINGRNLYIAFDGDSAGRKAGHDAKLHFEFLGAKVKIVEIPDGEDVNSFCLKNGIINFLNLKKS